MKEEYPDLNSLQAFVVVVRLQGFTAAAKALGVSVATVTRWINELERARRCKLFSSRKPLRLSVAGEAYFSSLDKLLMELNQVAVRLDDEMTMLAGDIHLLAPVNFSQAILADLLIDFARRYPEINIQLSPVDDPKKTELADIDLGIVVGVSPPQDWVARLLGPSTMMLCASHDFLAQHGLPTSPQELEQYDLVSHGNHLRWAFYSEQDRARTCQIDIRPRFQVKDMGMVRQAVESGLGIGNLPQFFLQPLIEQNKLVRILPDWQCEPRSISLIYPHREYLPRRVRVLIDFLVPALSGVLQNAP